MDSQGFFKFLIPEEIILSAIILFTMRFEFMIAQNVRLCEFSYPGLPKYFFSVEKYLFIISLKCRFRPVPLFAFK